jgi:hypothetical protein
VNKFRNFLMVCGASFGSASAVKMFYWWLVYPFLRLTARSGSLESAVVLAGIVSVTAAVLAGIASALAVETDRPTGWGFLVAVLVALASPGIGFKYFTSASEHGLAEFVLSVVGGVSAFASFHIVRSYSLRRSRLANAR